MVGLDTGHVIEFTKILHDRAAPPEFCGVRIVGAVQASDDIDASLPARPDLPLAEPRSMRMAVTCSPPNV